MVKKVSFKSQRSTDDFDLDAFLNESDSLTSDLSFEPTVKDKKGHFAAIKKGTVDGIKSTLKSPSFYKKMVKSVLPDVYGEALEGPRDIYNQLSNLYSDSVRELKPGFQQISRQVDKLIPDEQKSLKKFTRKMKELSGADLDSSSSSMTAEQMRDSSISSSLSAIFGLQAEQSITQRANDKAAALINQQVELRRFNTNATMLAGIQAGVNRLSAYNERINQAYQRKSLELQLRSLFVQTDSLALARTAIETTARQNNVMIRLLSMSEQEKIMSSEAYKKKQNGLFGGNYTGLLSKSRYGEAVKNRLKSAVNDKVGDLKYRLEQMIFNLDSIGDAKQSLKDFDIDPREAGASTLSSMLLEGLGGHFIKKNRDKILKPGSKIDNQLGSFFALLRDPASLIESAKGSKALKTNINDFGTMRGSIKDFLKDKLDLFRPPGVSTYLGKKGMSLKELSAPASFTNRTQRSITEVIPGYLARILREIQVLRTGNQETGLTEFNNVYGKFMSAKRSAAATTAYARKQVGSYGFGYASDNAVKSLLGDVNVSPETKQQLSKRIKHIVTNPSAPLHTSHVFSEDYLKQLDPAVRHEMEKVAQQYQEGSEQYGRKRNLVSKDLQSARNSIVDNREIIEALSDDPGALAALKKAGLIKGSARTGHSIDYGKYTDFTTGRSKFSSEDIISDFERRGLIDNAIKERIVKRNEDGSMSVNQSEYQKYIRDGKVLGSGFTSDFHAKKGVQQVHPKSMLDGMKNTNIYKWFYKSGQGRDKAGHLGPMAQDLQKNLGDHVAPGGTSVDQISLNGAMIGSIGQLGRESDATKAALHGGPKSIRETLLDISANTAKTVELLEHRDISMTMPISGLEMGDVQSMLKSGKIKMADIVGGAAEGTRSGLSKAQIAMRNRIERFIKVYSVTAKIAASAANRGMNLATKVGYAAYHHGSAFLKNTALPYLKTGVQRLGSVLGEAKLGLQNQLNPIIDVYSNRDPKKRLLSAKDIEDEHYIDQDSGKIIRKMDDIKGPVIDRRGNVLVDLKDLQAGLINAEGEPIRNFSGRLRHKAEQLGSFLRKTITQKLPSGIRLLAAGLHAGGNFIKNAVNAPRDIYVKGRLTQPILLAKDMIAGRYIDLKTKKVIKTLSDITGPVIDQAGNYVITEENIKQGLVDISGKPIVNFKQLVTGALIAGAGALGSFAKKALSKTTQFLKDMKFPNIQFPSFGIYFGEKQLGVLEEIRDILRDRLSGSGGGGGESEGEGGEMSSGQSAVAQGDSFGLLKDAASTGKSLLNTAGDKLSELKNSSRAQGMLGRLKSSKGISRLGKVGGFLKKIPGVGRIGKGLSFLGGAASSLLSGSGNKEESEHGSAIKENIAEEGRNEEHEDALQDHKTSRLARMRQSAGDAYHAVRQSLLGKQRSGTNMTEINAREKELEERRRSRNQSTSQASLDPRYMGGSSLLSGVMGKLKGFKGMLSKAFDFITSIPGLGKLGKFLGKIPGASKILGLGKAALGLGGAAGAAEGAAGAAVAAEGATAAAASGGLMSTLLGGAGSVALGAGSLLLEGATAVGGALLTGIGSIVSLPVIGTGLAIAALGAGAYYGFKYLTRNKVTPIGQFRMAQYGLTPALDKYNHYLLNLEKYFAENCIAADSKGKPTIREGSVDMKKVWNILGVDQGNKQEVQASAIYLYKRFLPVLINTTAAVWSVNKKLKVTDIDSMSPEQQDKFIKISSFTAGPYDISTSPFPDLDRLPANLNWVKFEYKKAKAYVDDRVGTKKTLEKSEKINPHMAANLDNVHNPIKAYGLEQKKEAVKMKQQAAQSKSTVKLALDHPTKQYAVASVPATTGHLANQVIQPGKPSYPAKAFKEGAINYNKNTSMAVNQDAVKNFDNIALSGDSRSAIRNMVGQIAASQGVNPPLVQTIAALESGFNPDAQASTSSAAGLFQFINRTWSTVMRKYGAAFGLSPNTPKTDPKASALMGTLYLKNNLNYISQVKPNPTPTDAYLTHFLGPGGARQILSALNSNPNAIAQQILPAAASANKWLFYAKGNTSQPYTVAEFYNNMTNHINHVASEYGIDVGGAQSPMVASKESPGSKSGTEAAKPKTAALNKVVAKTEKKSTTVASTIPKAASAPGVSRSTMSASMASRGGMQETAYHPQATPTAPVRAASVAPVSTQHLVQLHSRMGDVSDILADSRDIQMKMLDGINALVDQKTGASSPQRQASGNPKSQLVSTKSPKPSIDLSRRV